MNVLRFHAGSFARSLNVIILSAARLDDDNDTSAREAIFTIDVGTSENTTVTKPTPISRQFACKIRRQVQ